MSRCLKVKIDPTVFKWLRESSGWTIRDLGKRLKTSEKAIIEMESGKRDPTLRQLREMSKAYNRPMAAFFLSEPVKEKERPKDFRMLPDRKNEFDKKTIMILRKARMLQENSDELSKNIGYNTRPKVEKAVLSDDPDLLSQKYRTKFELDETRQTSFRDAYEMFNYLRDILEELNILVYQDSIPVEDARGFALPDYEPNMIVLSTKDPVEARLFSLMHEFGHILLNKPAIDIPDFKKNHQNKIESWCNRFSSSFLLPESLARSVFRENREQLTVTTFLNGLSRRYKVSKGMLLFNMLRLSFISEQEYNDVIERYKPSGKEEEKERRGGIPAERKCLSMVGNKFVSLVANNYDRKIITYTDALKYLSIKSKNFEKVMAKAGK